MPRIAYAVSIRKSPQRMGRDALAGEGHMNSGSIAVLGRAVWDDWEDAVDDAPAKNFGGAAGNVAFHLANLGLHVRLATAFGMDENSVTYQRYLAAKGIDLRASIQKTRPLPRCRIRLKEHTYSWADNDDGFESLPLVDVASATRDCDAVFFADFPLGRVPQFPMGQRLYAAPQHTLSKGFTTVNDLTRLKWEAVFLNRKEADELERKCPVSVLSARVPGYWIVTDGARPTELYHHGSKTTHPVPPATVVNAIGGGDAFAAGVVAGLETSHEIRYAIMIGQAAAGIIVEQLSCQSDRVNWRDIDSRRGTSWA